MDDVVRYTTEDRMSSLEIAALTCKPHKNVMRSIRDMEPAWERISGLKFELASYIDKQGKERPCYQLTKRECLYVATKFNDDSRAKLVLRWEELESAKPYQVPTTFREALLLAAEQQGKIEEQQKMLAAKDEQVSALTNRLTEMSAKVSYLDQILQNKSTVTITQIAQDYGVSAKSLNKTLHQMGIQHKVNDQWILYAKYLTEGYVHSCAVEIPSAFGTRVKYNTQWTQKGRLFLYEKLKMQGILPLIEKV